MRRYAPSISLVSFLESSMFSSAMYKSKLLASSAIALVIATGHNPAIAVSAHSDDFGNSSERHYVREGHRVTLNLITYQEWEKSYKNQLGITLPNRPDPVTIDKLEAVPADRAAIAGAVVGAVAGIVIDLVEKELKREAAKHEQQFKALTYADDFWEGFDQPKYVAIEIIREAGDYTSAKDQPAFRMIFYLDPSDHDSRMFLLRPVYLRVIASGARVSALGGDRCQTITVNTIMEAAEFNDKGAFSQTIIANNELQFVGYNLNESNELTSTYDRVDNAWTGELTPYVAGYFRAPRAKGNPDALADIELINSRIQSLRDDDQNQHQEAIENLETERSTVFKNWVSANKGGAFKLFVLVTESDDSRTKQTLLDIAEFVGSNKDKAIEFIQTQVGGN